MKLLLLDIDGVLNTRLLRSRYGRDYVCPSRTARVDEICQRTGAKIVLSTSWVRCDGVVKTTAFLRGAGLKADIVGAIDYNIETTDAEQDAGLSDRVKRILAYLVGKDVVSYVALDDLYLVGVPLVHTTDTMGLLNEHVEKAVHLLGPL